MQTVFRLCGIAIINILEEQEYHKDEEIMNRNCVYSEYDEDWMCVFGCVCVYVHIVDGCSSAQSGQRRE